MPIILLLALNSKHSSYSAASIMV